MDWSRFITPIHKLPAILRKIEMKTNSENIISIINSNVFFKEFTFSKNDFKELDTKQNLEFADNVVWLNDIFFFFFHFSNKGKK